MARKQTKKQQIASLINTLQVAQLMRDTAKDEQTIEQFRLSEAYATCTLADAHGIELVCLAACRARVQRHVDERAERQKREQQAQYEADQRYVDIISRKYA